MKIRAALLVLAFLLAASAFADTTSVTVSPANQTIQVGGALQFSALDQNGRDITSGVTWSSSNPTVVTISPTGLATGIATGVVTISATSNPQKPAPTSLELTIQ